MILVNFLGEKSRQFLYSGSVLSLRFIHRAFIKPHSFLSSHSQLAGLTTHSWLSHETSLWRWMSPSFQQRRKLPCSPASEEEFLVWAWLLMLFGTLFYGVKTFWPDLFGSQMQMCVVGFFVVFHLCVMAGLNLLCCFYCLSRFQKPRNKV